MRVELVDHAERLEHLRDEWDALCVDLAQPFTAPTWALAWWSEARAPGSVLRCVAAFEDDCLVGLLPLCAEPVGRRLHRYRFLASSAVLRTGPLCRPDLVEDFAANAAVVLAATDPPVDLIRFDGVGPAQQWVGLLTDAWPGRSPSEVFDIEMPAPFVSIEGSYDAWFAAKSKNFREQMRRRRKKFAAAGGTFRAATEATLDADFDAFVRLHHRRWEARGGSGVLTPGVEKAVYRVAKESLSSGRVRLWSMEVAGAVISSHFFAAAGGEVSYWLGGFDDSWGSHQPSLQVLLIALEQAFAMGDSRFDLGGGGQAYKYRLADSDEPVVWTHLVPHGPHRGLARLALGPRQLRRAVLARLPDGTKNRVKRLVGRQVFDGPPRAS